MHLFWLLSLFLQQVRPEPVAIIDPPRESTADADRRAFIGNFGVSYQIVIATNMGTFKENAVTYPHKKLQKLLIQSEKN